ncbi:dephospho-CoA kinase [Pelovirga terrestris]|uniref:Dephospho-CoA kinase n=1 Tax=Pelovirga terrestris TaxID=2771352 RepID=A0A8J6R672_9BACT|nr:dephospho-CoA kinase [Pelovirga terrestris]
MILGVTGNIASGKSSVCRELARRGAPVVDADQLAREVVAPDSPVLEQLVAAFGEKILKADGSLDREYLGALVFSDPSARERLNAIIHPAIAALSVQRLQQLRDTAPLVIYEAPLLYEVGAETRVDKVLLVTIDPAVQLARLMERDGLDEQSARQRIAAQMPQDQKIARADYLVDNSASRAETIAQIEELWPLLMGELLNS